MLSNYSSSREGKSLLYYNIEAADCSECGESLCSSIIKGILMKCNCEKEEQLR